jgi:hypothetical protein
MSDYLYWLLLAVGGIVTTYFSVIGLLYVIPYMLELAASGRQYAPLFRLPDLVLYAGLLSVLYALGLYYSYTWLTAGVGYITGCVLRRHCYRQ